MNVISLLVWMLSFLLNTPYFFNYSYGFVKPLKNNFCFLTTWRLVYIDNIYYMVFFVVTFFIIPETIMIYMTVVINNVKSPGEREIVLNHVADIREVTFDSNSESIPEENEAINSTRNTGDENLMTKEEKNYFTNLLKFKLNYLKLIISLLLSFVFTTVLTQILYVTQKFNLFSEYQNSPEFKLFILLSIFLIYSISGVNCIIFLYYSNTLRRHSLELLIRIVTFFKRL
jgi:hypothetical protein